MEGQESDSLSTLIPKPPFDVPSQVPKNVLWLEAAAGTQVETLKVKRIPKTQLFFFFIHSLITEMR